MHNASARTDRLYALARGGFDPAPSRPASLGSRSCARGRSWRGCPPTGGCTSIRGLESGPPTEIDPRQPGEALWEEQHGAALLAAKRRLDPPAIRGDVPGPPLVPRGLLYGLNFAEYDDLPREIVRRANYTDTADTGDDYLCSICYAVDADGVITSPMRSTRANRWRRPSRWWGEALVRSDTRQAAVEKATTAAADSPGPCRRWLRASGSSGSTLRARQQGGPHPLQFGHGPAGTPGGGPGGGTPSGDLPAEFRANRWHDAADVVTGIIEREVAGRDQRVRGVRFCR